MSTFTQNKIYLSSTTVPDIKESEVVYGYRVRPQLSRIIHDGAKDPADVAILERYYVDIQNLFLKRLSAFSSDGDNSPDGQDAARLRSLLDEMVKVKALIQKGI